MITNERQYRITKAQLARLEQAVDSFDLDDATNRLGSSPLANAELDALNSEVAVLTAQIREYDQLKSGSVEAFEASSIDELPALMIRTRIARGLTQKDLAELVGVKEQQIQRYESSLYASASFSRIRDVAHALEIGTSKIDQLSPGPAHSDAAPQEIDWGRFPVIEMYKRNWFSDFNGDLASAKRNGPEIAKSFVLEAMPRRAAALLKHRVRSDGHLDDYALWAWQCRALIMSRQHQLAGSFRKSAITVEWLRQLAQLSEHEDGPIRAGSYLAEAGIRLVVEPHLPGTYLDGASFFGPDGPVVALTLRHDRVDNFWFVLLHEVVHVWKHLGRDLTAAFDDIDSVGDGIEQEADDLAGSVLIPDDIWETAVARYTRTPSAIAKLASNLCVSPAIVAGRIRREASNYAILHEMVGQGSVRRLFSEIQFG